jgi:hypothetical protein
MIVEVWIGISKRACGNWSVMTILGVICLSGCADRMVLLRYEPSLVSRSATAPSFLPPGVAPGANTQPITIYQFADYRGPEADGDVHRVGGVYNLYGSRFAKVMTAVPFTSALAIALASALQARGVRATSAEDSFIPGTTRVPTPLAMWGEIHNFSTESRGGIAAHVSGIVRVYDKTGRLLVEQQFSARDHEGLGSGTDTLEKALNRAMALFVHRVGDDPDITRVLMGGSALR